MNLKSKLNICLFIAVVAIYSMCIGFFSSQQAYADEGFVRAGTTEYSYTISGVGKKQKNIIEKAIKKVIVEKVDADHTYLKIERTNNGGLGTFKIFSRDKDKKSGNIIRSEEARQENDYYTLNESWLTKDLTIETTLRKRKKEKELIFNLRLNKVKNHTETVENPSGRLPYYIPKFQTAIAEEATAGEGKFYIPEVKAKANDEECAIEYSVVDADGNETKLTNREYDAKGNFILRYKAISTKYKTTDGKNSEVIAETKVKTTTLNHFVSSDEEVFQAFKYQNNQTIEMAKKKFKTYEKAKMIAYEIRKFDESGKEESTTSKTLKIDVPSDFNIKKTEVYALKKGKLVKMKAKIDGDRLSIKDASGVNSILLIQKGFPKWGGALISIAVMIILASSVIIGLVVSNKKKEKLDDIESEEEEIENDR